MQSPLFLVALLLVAANLRAALTGVGPLLPVIQQDLSLSATAAGLLGSLPLLMFALFAPLARLGARFGAERLVLAGLVALALGILLRSEGHVASLYAGTVLLAAAIAMTNVLVPTLVKQHFPGRVPLLTSAYATVMQVFASLGSGIAVPLLLWLPGGWRASLASWVLLALVTIAFLGAAATRAGIAGASECGGPTSAVAADPGLADRRLHGRAVHLVLRGHQLVSGLPASAWLCCHHHRLVADAVPGDGAAGRPDHPAADETPAGPAVAGRRRGLHWPAGDHRHVAAAAGGPGLVHPAGPGCRTQPDPVAEFHRPARGQRAHRGGAVIDGAGRGLFHRRAGAAGLRPRARPQRRLVAAAALRDGDGRGAGTVRAWRRAPRRHSLDPTIGLL